MKKVIKVTILSFFLLPMLISFTLMLMLSKGDTNTSNDGNDLVAGEITLVGDFALPFPAGSFTFSRSIYPGHAGIDFVVPYGTAVVAMSDAEVYQASSMCTPDGGYLGNWCPFDNVAGGGNYVVLKFQHEQKDIYVQYAHMSQVNVKKGMKVKRGDIIGAVGNSGNSSGTHMHMEAHVGGVYAGSDLNVVRLDKIFGL